MGDMKIAYLFLLTVSLAWTADMSGPENAVRAAVASFLQAAQAGDEAALNRMLGTGLIYAHSSGNVQNKTQCMAAIVKTKPRFTFNDGWTVQVYGNSAIVHGKMVSHHTRPEPDSHIGVLMVWIKEGGNDWQLAARHTNKPPLK
jgi:ketosteroid isomerase-like protein